MSETNKQVESTLQLKQIKKITNQCTLLSLHTDTLNQYIGYLSPLVY